MITIASIGDMHWWLRNRWQETLKIGSWTLQDIAARKPDVIVIGGDIFEEKSEIPERNAFGEWLDAARRIAPVFGARGNHDEDGDLNIFNRIPDVHIALEPEVLQVPGLPLQLALLPWPHKAHLLASMEKAAAPEDVDRLAVEHLRNILRRMDQPRSLGQVPYASVMVAHAMLDGSRTSTGQPLRVGELRIGLDDLALARCHAYLLSHVHAPQEWTVRFDDIEAPVIYNGSWRRTTYGETETKGYVLMRLLQHEDGLLDRKTGEYTAQRTGWRAEWERIATPCAPMHLFEARWEPGAGFVDVVVDSGASMPGPLDHAENPPIIPMVAAAGWEGAEIRFRYSVDSDQVVAARAAAKRAAAAWKDAGAVDVVLDPEIVPKTRARVPEIATASSTWDKLEVLWRARSEEMPPGRSARLRAKLGEIEAE